MSLSEFEPTYLQLDHQEDVTIARFNVARLTDDENIEQLGHELFVLVDQYARRKVVLSLAIVEYLTSSVVGKIITLHRKLHRLQGTLVLCQLLPQVQEVLRVSRLIDYFNTEESVELAVARLHQA